MHPVAGETESSSPDLGTQLVRCLATENVRNRDRDVSQTPGSVVSGMRGILVHKLRANVLTLTLGEHPDRLFSHAAVTEPKYKQPHGARVPL